MFDITDEKSAYEAGLTMTDKNNFEEIFIKFMNTSYSPKEYVKKELSYDVSIKKLISIFLQ